MGKLRGPVRPHVDGGQVGQARCALSGKSEAVGMIGVMQRSAALGRSIVHVVKLARVEAVATRDGVEAELHEEAGLPA